MGTICNKWNKPYLITFFFFKEKKENKMQIKTREKSHF